MEQMVSHIIYGKHIREKTHQANSHKQEPKDNQNENWNLFEPTCHIEKR